MGLLQGVLPCNSPCSCWSKGVELLARLTGQEALAYEALANAFAVADTVM